MITKYFNKSTLRMLLLAIPVAVAGLLQSCSEEDPFFAASENDYPRILNPELQGVNNDGSMMALPEINRDENFNLGIIATPRAYTTIDWFIDGEHVFTGDTIDMPLLAGDYVVKVTATTTKGLSTYRERTLHVAALAGDPTLAADAKSRWLNPGADVTINGADLDNVVKLYVDGIEAENFVNNGTSVSFTVPAGAKLGSRNIVVETADGTKYGCGKANVTDEKYVEPGIKEIVLWEGATEINWGTSNVTVSSDVLADVPVGTIIKVFYEMVDMPEGYHAMRVTTPWWGDNAEDQVVAQFDLTAEIPNPFEFEYTEANKAIVDERGGMLFVGYGYKITKIAYDKRVAPLEKTLWEGATEINWGTSNVTVLSDVLADVPVGKTICMYYDMVDMPEGYHAMRVTTPWWGDNAEDQVVAQFDLTAETPNPYEFEYTEANKAIVDERGGMLIVGYGYKLTKVTVK